MSREVAAASAETTPIERAIESLARSTATLAREMRRMARRQASIERRLGILEDSSEDEDEDVAPAGGEASGVSIDTRRGLRARVLPGWWSRNWRTVVVLVSVAFGGWGTCDKIETVLSRRVAPPPRVEEARP